MLRRAASVVLALFVGLAATSAGATGFGFTIEVDGVGFVDSSSVPLNVSGPVSGVTTYTLGVPSWNANSIGQGDWSIDLWQTTANVDPFVNNNFLITNSSGATQTFTVIITQPIPAQNVDQYIASSITASVLDSDGNAGTSAATLGQSGGTPIYQAFLNAPPPAPTTLDLLPPFDFGALPVTCSANGCNATTSTLPKAGAFAPVLATSIGIQLTFTLTDGDSASVLSRFEVVPEPGTGLLVGLGLLAVAWVRRR